MGSGAGPLALLEPNALQNGLEVETLPVDWADPTELIERAPFDLVLAADVLYERPGVAQLLELLPRLAAEAWIAEPGRPAAEPFLEHAEKRWSLQTSVHGVVNIHRLMLRK
jgi:predicted nicotinamide N-methyase